MFAGWESTTKDTACNIYRGNFDIALFTSLLTADVYSGYFFAYDSSQIASDKNPSGAEYATSPTRTWTPRWRAGFELDPAGSEGRRREGPEHREPAVQRAAALLTRRDHRGRCPSRWFRKYNPSTRPPCGTSRSGSTSRRWRPSLVDGTAYPIVVRGSWAPIRAPTSASEAPLYAARHDLDASVGVLAFRDTETASALIKFIISRILQAIPVIFMIAVVSFGLMQLAPGGPQTQFNQNPRILSGPGGQLAEELVPGAEPGCRRHPA